MNKFLILLPAAILFAIATAASAQSPPPNDDFVNRQVISPKLQVTVAGTDAYATQEAFEKVYGGGGAYGYGINETNTVWYSYTPAVSGKLHLSMTRDTNYETYTIVFQGSATPVEAAIVSQGYLPLTYEVTANGVLPPPPDVMVTAGEEYTISLGNSPAHADEDENFKLTLTLTPGPVSTVMLPVASVTAKTNKADRAANTPGKLVFTLSTAASADVTVAYKASGSAVPGTDYKALTGEVVVPAGATSASVKVKPRTTSGGEAEPATVAVKVKLQAGNGYTVGTASTAKVKIIDGQ